MLLPTWRKGWDNLPIFGEICTNVEGVKLNLSSNISLHLILMLLKSKSISFGTEQTAPNWLAFSKQLNERGKNTLEHLLKSSPLTLFWNNKSWMLHYYHLPGTTKYKHFQLKCNCNLLLFLLLLLGIVQRNICAFFSKGKTYRLHILPSFSFWTLTHKDKNLSEEKGMDASSWHNSCNSLLLLIAHEFIKSLSRVAHLVTAFILYIAEDDQLIIPCSSMWTETHMHLYTHKRELFLEGENYPWQGMDWCKYSIYFHSACSLTVGLKRALNKPLFHILLAACLKVSWRRFRGWYKSYQQGI